MNYMNKSKKVLININKILSYEKKRKKNLYLIAISNSNLSF